MDAAEFECYTTMAALAEATKRIRIGALVTGVAYRNAGRTADAEREKAIFDKLSAEADKALLDDLRDLPFGSYGHLADKYGVHWFFQGERSDSA